MSDDVEYLELTSDSLAARQAHRNKLLDIEARKRAATIDVPTLPSDVRDALRNLGEPIRLFGEDLAAIRERLRMILARWDVWKEQKEQGLVDDLMDVPMQDESQASVAAEGPTEVTETTYTHATKELTKARKFLAQYSLDKSRQRLDKERHYRRGMIRYTRTKKRARLFDKQEDENENETAANSLYNSSELKADEALVKGIDDHAEELYTKIKRHVLEGSQYGDVRPLSAVCTSTYCHADGLTSNQPKLIATGGWSGGIKIWNGGDDDQSNNGAPLDLLGAKNVVHEDRIMGIAMRPYLTSNTEADSGITTLVATASIDLTAKLCAIKLNDGAIVSNDDAMDVENLNVTDNKLRYEVTEVAHLKGHAARLCSVAFHPSGRYVATTSFDHTWRLWDVETSNMESGNEILLQDGHAREVYGVGFHPDGSLVSTTDFGGVVQCWDLRTGKSACHFIGHAKRVVCAEFSPNGFQLATAGDDGLIKIWDMRRRKVASSIPAHTNLITQLKFSKSTGEQNGEFLVSSSYDNTVKIWSTRDWKLRTALQGHEGKVMGVDVLDGPDCGVVTCGFDKTLKLWR